MSRLIDADALKKIFEEHKALFVDECGGFSNLPPKEKARVDELDNCIADVMNAPTVDAVEVVRCADCVLEGTENCPMVHRDPMFGNLYCTFPANGGYCSKGVRRKDET